MTILFSHSIVREAALGRSWSQDWVDEHQERADHALQSWGKKKKDTKHDASMVSLIKNPQRKMFKIVEEVFHSVFVAAFHSWTILSLKGTSI